MGQGRADGGLTRRQLLRQGAVAVAGGVLLSPLVAACGGGSSSGGASTAPATGAGTGDTTVAGATSAGDVGGTIDFLSWEGYDIPDAMAPWKETAGVTLNPTYIGNHDDIQAKIKAGGGSFDLITYYQGYKPLYYDALEIIGPLDTGKLPNLAGLFPFFSSNVGTFWQLEDGTQIGVPFTWGAGGMNYDASVLPSPPTSYFDVLEPEFSGKVTFPDDPTGAYSLGSVALGYDVSKLTPDQFQEVTDFLKQMVSQTKGIASSYGDMTTLIVSGEATVAPLGWAAMNKFAAEAGKDTVKITIPKEGAAGFCDAWAIPTSADNVDTALAWINQTLDPKTNAAAANSLAGGITVAAAADYLDPEIRALYPYDDLDAFMEQVTFFDNPPLESTEYATYEQVVDAWQDVKLTA